MAYDVVIVGAGPAGLSCAIRLKQINPSLSVCVLEKGSEVGAHILSGAVLETRALDELIPDWKDKDAPLNTKATKDQFLFLTKKRSFRLPLPPSMNNHGNYIISLGNFTRWLAGQAEALGVEIFPGFAAAEILYDADDAVIGVATGDVGLDKEGNKTSHFQPGMELHARQTILAEGAHGSLSKIVMRKYALREDSDPQTYGLGIKELWEVDPAVHRPGLAIHTVGWPMDRGTYGGSWIYHMENNLVSIGFVVGLDYKNPYLSPYDEMQRFKLHPAIRPLLEGGRRVAYGARALVEGGFQSLPKLTFPGGLLIGDTAGFLNVPKIKGNHMAMKSGMVAAETLAEYLAGPEEGKPGICSLYPEQLQKSWLWAELKKVRNIRPGFHGGLWIGLLNAALETLLGGRTPWTLKNHADHKQLKKSHDSKPIAYPKPDGRITFDILTSVQLSNTHHAEDQPCHLKLKDPRVPIAVNLPEYDEPAQRYCPAAVYEIVRDEQGDPRFQINAQNCVHCKTCDIKDPSQNINWTVPEGGGGPNYPNM
ncbi:MAG: electron transfer flavoprotein-ubiquinone oxidoreductase [Alphaproteobacteria bacterium]|nr:electron transfer flavoprotein-ubiquinone oxidoreductase [Alphaproteobacteria bacterium]